PGPSPGRSAVAARSGMEAARRMDQVDLPPGDAGLAPAPDRLAQGQARLYHSPGRMAQASASPRSRALFARGFADCAKRPDRSRLSCQTLSGVLRPTAAARQVLAQGYLQSDH